MNTKKSMVEKLIKDQGIEIVYGKECASATPMYRLDNNTIEIPNEKLQGDDLIVTLLHEAVHASGIKGKLNRNELSNYYDDSLSRCKEEMVAELATKFISKELKLGVENHKSINFLIDGYAEVLNKVSPKDLLKHHNDIFTKAQEAKDYLISGGKSLEMNQKEVSSLNKMFKNKDLGR